MLNVGKIFMVTNFISLHATHMVAVYNKCTYNNIEGIGISCMVELWYVL